MTIGQSYFHRASVYGTRSRYQYDIHAVARLLERASIEKQQDFDALQFGAWTAFSPNESRVVFEICPSKAHRLVALDVELTHQSVVGDRYRREI